MRAVEGNWNCKSRTHSTLCQHQVQLLQESSNISTLKRSSRCNEREGLNGNFLFPFTFSLNFELLTQPNFFLWNISAVPWVFKFWLAALCQSWKKIISRYIYGRQLVRWRPRATRNQQKSSMDFCSQIRDFYHAKIQNTTSQLTSLLSKTKIDKNLHSILKHASEIVVIHLSIWAHSKPVE